MRMARQIAIQNFFCIGGDTNRWINTRAKHLSELVTPAGRRHTVPCVLSADTSRLSPCSPSLSPRSQKTAWCWLRSGSPSPPAGGEKHQNQTPNTVSKNKSNFCMSQSLGRLWRSDHKPWEDFIISVLPEPPPPWRGTGTCRAGLWCSSPASGSRRAETRSHSEPAS